MSNHALKTIHVVAALIFRDTPQKQVLATQRGYGDFKGYDLETPQNTILAVPDVYGEIYEYYIKMNIDLRNGEIERFNNNAVLFNRTYKELFDYINRKEAVKKQTKISAGDLIV